MSTKSQLPMLFDLLEPRIAKYHTAVKWPSSYGAIHGPGTVWYAVEGAIEFPPAYAGRPYVGGREEPLVMSQSECKLRAEVNLRLTRVATSDSWDLSDLSHSELEVLAVALDAQLNRGAGVKGA